MDSKEVNESPGVILFSTGLVAVSLSIGDLAPVPAWGWLVFGMGLLGMGLLAYLNGKQG